MADAVTGLADSNPSKRPESEVIDPLIYRLLQEIARQDDKHGRFSGTTQLGRSRLGLACLEDEVAEALQAWREERRAPTFENTRAEVLQVATVALRLLRDAL
jgi:hypothetical protein